MKKILFYAVAMTTMAISACSEVATLEAEVPDERATKMVTINASSLKSRAAVQDDWTIQWEAGDALAALDYSGEYKLNLTEGDGSTNGTFEGEVANDGTYSLVYPYLLVDGWNPVSHSFSVDLTGQVAGLDKTYMVSSEMFTADDLPNASVAMEHITSAAVLKLELKDYYDKEIKCVIINGLNSKGSYSPGSMTPLSGTSANAIMITNCGTVSADGEATIKFNILPTTLKSGESFKVTVYINSSSGVKVLKESLTTTSGFSFEAGKYHDIVCDGMEKEDGRLVSDSSFDNDDPTTKDIIEIATAEELSTISLGIYQSRTDFNFNSASYKLIADIDLGGKSWVPIGFGAYQQFNGTFDGNGHTISGLYIPVDAYNVFRGLFGYTIGATIKNLTVNGYVQGNSVYCAGIVGRAFNSTIENCTSRVIVEVNGDNGNYVGGIAGDLTYNSSITNCHNLGTVTGNKYVGGVVGQLADSEMTECDNSGAVKGAEAVGGVVGLAEFNSNNIIVNKCYNTASVTTTSNKVGGIVGDADGDNELVVINCYNSGTIYTKDNGVSYAYAGGVVGYLYNTSATVANCYNSGAVEGDDNVYVAGLVGLRGSSSLINCCNYSDVNTTMTTLFGCLYGEVSSGAVTKNNYYDRLVSDHLYGFVDASGTKNTLGAMDTRKMQESTFVDKLNTNVDSYNTDTPALGIQACKWTTGDDGYPAFLLAD